MRRKRRGSVAVVWCGVAAVVLLLAAYGLQTPADASSASGLPGVRTLGSISEQYMPVKFDHPKHVMMAGSCAACHHQHRDTKKLDCKECHEIGPATFRNSVSSNFLACSACHGTFDPGAPAVPGLKVAYHKSCFQCHRGMGGIGAGPKGCTEICHAKKTATAGMQSRP